MPLFPPCEILHSRCNSKFSNSLSVIISPPKSPPLPRAIRFPSWTIHPFETLSFLKFRQPFVVFPSNKSSQSLSFLIEDKEFVSLLFDALFLQEGIKYTINVKSKTMFKNLNFIKISLIQ